MADHRGGAQGEPRGPLVSADGRGRVGGREYLNARIALAREIASKRGQSPGYAPKNPFFRLLAASQYSGDVVSASALPASAGRNAR